MTTMTMMTMMKVMNGINGADYDDDDDDDDDDDAAHEADDDDGVIGMIGMVVMMILLILMFAISQTFFHLQRCAASNLCKRRTKNMFRGVLQACAFMLLLMRQNSVNVRLPPTRRAPRTRGMRSCMNVS